MRLVLLPGMEGTGLLFSRFIAALGPGCDVTVVDYPATQPLDYAELEALARLRLPQNEPFLMLGESFSGPIAISIAASTPPGLRGLILCCTFARNPVPIFRRFGPLLRFVPFNRIPNRCLRPFLWGRFSTKALRLEHARALSGVSNEVLRARIKAVFEVDVGAKLQQVPVPILAVRASEDRLVPRVASEHVRRLAPALRMVELEGPHLLLQAMPSASAELIHEFWREAMNTS